MGDMLSGKWEKGQGTEGKSTINQSIKNVVK
jgi:hypothetical protein